MPGSVKHLDDKEIQRRLEVWESCGRSSRQAAQTIGIGRRAMDRFLDRYAHDAKTGRQDPMAGSLAQTDIIDLGVPTTTRRYLLTCAQNQHPGPRRLLAQPYGVRPARRCRDQGQPVHLQPRGRLPRPPESRRRPHNDRRGLGARDQCAPTSPTTVEALAPTLVWCGNLQILPTAADPLSGFDDIHRRGQQRHTAPESGYEAGGYPPIACRRNTCTRRGPVP
jgi:hypothetical protein